MNIPNNNKKIISKLTSRTLSANKTRNLYVILAIALTTFLITSVFSLGMSYMKSLDLQQLRVMGTTSHANVKNPTEAQINQLRSTSYIDNIGLQTNVGTIVNSPEMGNLVISLFWLDQAEWEQFRVPAMTDIVGAYPQQDNEIMINSFLLEQIGITQPEVGMEIELSYHPFDREEGANPHSKRFILSGYYTDYMNIRAGNLGYMLVSQSFKDSTGLSPEDSGSASVHYTDMKDVEGTSEQLAKDLKLDDPLRVKTVPNYQNQTTADTGFLLGLGSLILFIMLSGYLLIYNVLHISVSKDIRYYGLLKTIGTTPHQVRRIVMGQAIRLSWIGIPVGMLIGTAASFAIIPLALNSYKVVETGAEISFSLWIYAGSILFSLLTTWISCIKPARLAGRISPIEAVRYTGVKMKRKHKKGTHGGKLSRMALRNMFRDKKRAVLVFLSLFMGITTFMVLNTVVMSLNFNNFVSSYIENDFDLFNNSASVITTGGRKQTITPEMVAAAKEINGVNDVRTTTTESIQLDYDPNVYSKHLTEFAKKYDIEPYTKEAIENEPELFWAYAVGIDSRYIQELNKGSKAPIDLDAFERGDIVLISTTNTELFQLGADIGFTTLVNEQHATFKLGGFLPDGFQLTRGGMAPNIYMSEQALAKLVKEPIIDRVNIQSDDEQASTIERAIKQIIAPNIPGITVRSKIEMEGTFADMKMMLATLGGGMSIILALIGILNFINVMVTGVNVRRQEFAVMESIGMTKKQLTTMLIYEGLGYAIISSALILSLGSLITYTVFLMYKLQADYAVFTYPFLPIGIAIGLIFAVCVSVPILSYKKTTVQSVTERLRSSEG